MLLKDLMENASLDNFIKRVKSYQSEYNSAQHSDDYSKSKAESSKASNNLDALRGMFYKMSTEDQKYIASKVTGFKPGNPEKDAKNMLDAAQKAVASFLKVPVVAAVAKITDKPVKIAGKTLCGSNAECSITSNDIKTDGDKFKSAAKLWNAFLAASKSVGQGDSGVELDKYIKTISKGKIASREKLRDRFNALTT